MSDKAHCVGCKREGSPDEEAARGNVWAMISLKIEANGQVLDSFVGRVCSPGCLTPALRSLSDGADRADDLFRQRGGAS